MFSISTRETLIRSILVTFISMLLISCGGGKNAGSSQSAENNVNHAALSSSQNKLRLPLEVLSDGSPRRPLIVEANLGVSATKLASVSQLWFQCHRCGFYGAPEFEAVTDNPIKIKASVRLLGSDTTHDASTPWIDITDANVTLADDERLHGGLNGAFYTTRITLPLSSNILANLSALPKYNRVQFRFNGTDGESNGFRILKVQLQDSQSQDLGTNVIEYSDPQSERVIDNVVQTDVDAGRTLWHGHRIINKSSIVNRRLEAACASCHASNGRDLQYFNYSNNSIIQRSKFHGLTENQGRQIVSYLRYSLRNVPYVDTARPWNPPYQPGPGLDCNNSNCQSKWSAGAGLEAVLSSPTQAIAAIFGKPINSPLQLTQSDIDSVMNPNATMNVRETAIPMQFPDWNAWLPSLHPLDIWPANAAPEGSFENGAQLASGFLDPNGKYNGLITWLNTNKNPNGNMNDWSHLSPSQREQIMAAFTAFGWEAYTFIGGGRGAHVATSGRYGAQVGADNLQQISSSATIAQGMPGVFTTNAFIERSVEGMLHWNAVKQWELAQDYSLEGNQQWFIGEKNTNTGLWEGRGEAHGWPFNTPSVFYLAPHMIYQTDYDSFGNITREWYNTWESNNITASYYRSNQWYQLQMTINPGAQSGWVNFPMDWPYLLAFDDYLGIRVGSSSPAAKAAQSSHYVRLLQGRIKAAQYVNNSIPLYDPNQPDLVANAGRYGRAQVLKHLTTTNYLDTSVVEGIGPSRFGFLNDLSSGLYLKIINGSIQQFNILYSQTLPNAWRRCDPNNMQLGEPEPLSGFRYCLDFAKTPLGVNGDGTLYMQHDSLFRITTEQTEQYGVWKATQLGAEPVRLNIWRNWINSVWP